MKKIILASQSPRRKLLLEWAEINFDVRVKETDETFPAGIGMEETAIHIARNKAHAISPQPDEIVISADTIVVLDNEIIGKPGNAQEALTILRLLSGRTHCVITGVVISNGNKEISFADATSVDFYELTDEQIKFYINKYKPYDKAGAYAIQEWIGVIGIKSIHGDFYNVMGLPVSKVVKALQEFS